MWLHVRITCALRITSVTLGGLCKVTFVNSMSFSYEISITNANTCTMSFIFFQVFS